MSGTTRKYCILSSLIFPEKCPWKSFCGLVQCDLNEPEVVIFDKWCFVKAESSLPRSRFLDVTQRSPKRCVTSKKRLRGRLGRFLHLKSFAFKVRYLPPNIMDWFLWFLFAFHLPRPAPSPPPPPSALRSEDLTTSPKCGIKLNCQAKTSCLESITVLSVILE